MMRLNFRQALQEIRHCGAEFFLMGEDNVISSVDDEQCPILTLARQSSDEEIEDAIDAFEAGTKLGFSESAISRIMSAADNANDTKDRRALLAACGLTG